MDGSIISSFKEVLQRKYTWNSLSRKKVLMDNASIHRGKDVQNLCGQFSVQLYYLPPYSPDYNPIECSFHDLKAWIRRNQQLSAQFQCFENFLHFAVSQNRGLNAWEHFKKAGYVMERD